jgi:transcriptional regulator with XRE-family HTH domain
LTQESAADRLGVSQSKLSRVESGRVPYDQDFLEEAAKAYGATPASLIMRNPLLRDSGWSIDDKLLKATPEVRRQAFAVVETLLRTGTNG